MREFVFFQDKLKGAAELPLLKKRASLNPHKSLPPRENKYVRKTRQPQAKLCRVNLQ
jgi:hypothetical protein